MSQQQSPTSDHAGSASRSPTPETHPGTYQGQRLSLVADFLIWFAGPIAAEYFGVPDDPDRPMPRWLRRMSQLVGLMLAAGILILALTSARSVDATNLLGRLDPAFQSNANFSMSPIVAYPRMPTIIEHGDNTPMKLRLDSGWYGGPGPGSSRRQFGTPVRLQMTPTISPVHLVQIEALPAG